MLPWLLHPFRDLIPGLSVFRYVTFRTAMAAATAMLLSLLLGPWAVSYTHLTLPTIYSV